MRLAVWLRTRDQDIWIVTVEILLIAFVLLFEPSPIARVLALGLVMHLGWIVHTLLRLNRQSGYGARSRGVRSNHELRTHVIELLREIKRVEAFRRRAAAARLAPEQVDERIVAAQLQILTSASKVVKVVGRETDAPADISMFQTPRPSSRPTAAVS